jgi:hypothetical protein
MFSAQKRILKGQPRIKGNLPVILILQDYFHVLVYLVYPNSNSITTHLIIRDAYRK